MLTDIFLYCMLAKESITFALTNLVIVFLRIASIIAIYINIGSSYD